MMILSARLALVEYSCAAQESPASRNSIQPLERELGATNGAMRFHLAKSLASSHTKVTFVTLLELLKDKNVDISYAAAESLEARSNKAFSEDLIATIKTLRRDNRWPAYRASGHYPTPAMLTFLLDCLDEEIRFQKRRRNFDDRNCFYIAKSLELIVKTLKNGASVTSPDEGDLDAYQRFAISLHSLIEGRPRK